MRSILKVLPIVLGLAAIGIGASGTMIATADDHVEPPVTSTSTSRSTATYTPTTLSSLTTAVSPPVLARGSTGRAVRELQRRLRALHYEPGAADGRFGKATEYAVFAFEKTQGLAPTGQVGPADNAALASPVPPVVLRPNAASERIEVDMARQLLVVYRGGRVALISHVSTGSGRRYCTIKCQTAVTPIGSFTLRRHLDGWHQASLGGLYRPWYFTADGIAIHGARSVPLEPASHGCVRVPLGVADRLAVLAAVGEPVLVVGI